MNQRFTFLLIIFMASLAGGSAWGAPQLIEGELGLNNPGRDSGASGGAFRLFFPGQIPGEFPFPGDGVSYSVALPEATRAEVWVRVRGDGPFGALFHDFGTGAWTRTILGLDPSAWRWRKLGAADLPAGDSDLILAGDTAEIELDALVVSPLEIGREPVRPYAQALSFGGDQAAKQRVEVPGAFDLSAGSLTVESWAYLSSGTGAKWQALVTKGRDWGLLRFDSTRRIAFRTGGDDLLSTAELEADTWYHIAAVYDRSRQEKRIYLNGELDVTGPYREPLPHTQIGGVSAVLTLAGQDPNSIQAGDGMAGRFFGGQLDEVRLWSTARSAHDLAAHRDRLVRGNEAGLLGNWRLDGFGPLVRDQSTHNRNGQLLAKTALPVRNLGVQLAAPAPGNFAMQFDGSPSQVLRAPIFNEADAPSAPESSFDLTDHGTVEAWVWLDAIPQGVVNLVSKSSAGWALRLRGDKVAFHTPLRPPEETPDLTVEETLDSGTKTLELGQWYHLAGILDRDPFSGSLRKTLLIRNLAGDQMNVTTAGDLHGSLVLNDAPVTIGGAFSGRLDEVRVWRRALSQLQIDAQSTRSLNGTEPGLVAAWDFNELSGHVANRAIADPRSGLLGAALGGKIEDLDFLPGIPLGAALPAQYALSFNGTSQSIEIAPHADFNFATGFTIETWVKPLARGPLVLVMKGPFGYGLGLDEELRPIYITGPLTNDANGKLLNALPADLSLTLGEWFHVAVAVDTTADTVTFYINGVPAGVRNGAVINNNDGPLVIGREGTLSNRRFFGELDELRIWDRALSPVQLEIFALQELSAGAARFAGMVAWWNFNDGLGLGAPDQSGHGHHGTLQGLGPADYTFGHDFGTPTLPDGLDLSLNPDAAGLWIGTVELNKVAEIPTVGQPLTGTADTARFRLLLHVDSGGATRLLKDVVIMRKDLDDGNGGTTIAPVLVTDPSLLPGLTGITERNGKRVGLRFGSVAYDFEGFHRFMAGGVGPGLACTTNLTLGKTHPTNPYRHKFHPQHSVGFDLRRQIAISFHGNDGDPLETAPGYGVKRLTGIWMETITGLHKAPIRIEGKVELSRISDVSNLNDMP